MEGVGGRKRVTFIGRSMRPQELPGVYEIRVRWRSGDMNGKGDESYKKDPLS